MARRKCYTDEELRRILEESDNSDYENEVSDSESESTDNVEEQQLVPDEITALENEEGNAISDTIGEILKSKSGYEWKTQPPAATRRRAHNILNCREGLQNNR